MIRAGFLLGISVGLSGFSFGAEGIQRLDLFGSDPDRFEQLWRKQGFPLIAPTQYETRAEDGGIVVTGHSAKANRGLLREWVIDQPTVARLQWQWRVIDGLTGEIDERTKAGDDFTARVLVVFETALIPTRTRAINYLWSAREPTGSVFPSPYTRQVAHIVLQSGAAGAVPGLWRAEERDVLADYEAYFGEPASVISAVAIMVDADNTKQTATAEFKALFWEIKAAGDVSCP